MKAKYDELAEEVRAAVEALDQEEPPKLVARRLRQRVRFGGRAWEDDDIIAAGWEWFHRYGQSPSANDWNPAQLRRKDGAPEALERYLDGEWPSTATVVRHFGSWRQFLNAAEVPQNDDRVGRTRDDRAGVAEGWPVWTGWELIGGYRARAGLPTAAELGRRARVSPHTARMIERGMVPNPGLRMFLALAHALDVRPAALLEYRSEGDGEDDEAH